MPDRLQGFYFQQLTDRMRRMPGTPAAFAQSRVEVEKRCRMNVAGVENALIGMALFDMLDSALSKANGAKGAGGSPLVKAAADAFEAYVMTAEIGMGVKIAGAAMYGLNPGGGSASAITSGSIAPFMALNIMA
jgi:hypothetical protein